MEWYTILAIVLGVLIGIAAGFAGGFLYRKKVAEREIGSAEAEATRLINEAIRNGENRKKEMLLEAKEEIHKSRTENDREVKERRAELTKQERRLEQKETTLDKKTEAFERKEEELNKRLTNAAQTQAEAEKIRQQQLETLEQLSGLTQEQAKQYLLDIAVEDVLACEKGLFDYLDSKHPEIPAAIRDDKEIKEETEEQLKKAIEEFKESFLKENNK